MNEQQTIKWFTYFLFFFVAFFFIYSYEMNHLKLMQVETASCGMRNADGPGCGMN